MQEGTCNVKEGTHNVWEGKGMTRREHVRFGTCVTLGRELVMLEMEYMMPRKKR